MDRDRGSITVEDDEIREQKALESVNKPHRQAEFKNDVCIGCYPLPLKKATLTSSSKLSQRVFCRREVPLSDVINVQGPCGKSVAPRRRGYREKPTSSEPSSRSSVTSDSLLRRTTEGTPCSMSRLELAGSARPSSS
ncbi:hypothetical protein ACJRO7_003748 [Eucalyptus globulus]|uniref:Uncharacterized protein n=1 Tax=Eucalyptus globulus TaxID=34317 RepID=A0ABD3IXU3_EUCGL